MQANPEKFQAIAIGKKMLYIIYEYIKKQRAEN
jgi:hypothetical protein